MSQRARILCDLVVMDPRRSCGGRILERIVTMPCRRERSDGDGVGGRPSPVATVGLW